MDILRSLTDKENKLLSLIDECIIASEELPVLEDFGIDEFINDLRRWKRALHTRPYFD